MEPPPSINDLPPAVLARIFTLTDPRRDGLALLLTCRHWLAVAEAQCAQHLWGVVRLEGDLRLLQQQTQAALLAGLRRRAACLAELHVESSVGLSAAALTAFCPPLLDAAAAAPGLHCLGGGGGGGSPDQHVSICKVGAPCKWFARWARGAKRTGGR